MMNRVPSLNEIYNEYHRESFFAQKSFYPKAIKNFDKVLTPEKTEFLQKFQNFIKRNFSLIDWKLYIKACAQYFKRPFELKILGSLNANKIYRTYVNYNKMSLEKSTAEIESDILSSLLFIKSYTADSGLSFKNYFINRDDIMPIVLKHIYSGSVSSYLYACINSNTVFKIFYDIPDDVFFELFNCSRNDFVSIMISQKRDKIICISSLLNLINKIDCKFKELFDEKSK